MKRSFTLLEMLLVIAIIAVLTGIALPAAALARQKGRITTAKSDMHAIQLAFKALENTYGKMVKVESGSVEFNGKSVSETTKTISSTDYKYIKVANNSNLYNNIIIELSDPDGKHGTANKITAAKLNVNKRRMVVLEPKAEYDAADTIAHNADALWRDPWGNPYVILINTNRSNAIPDPADTSKLIGGSIILYSCGPDGVDNNGDVDDICSWK